MPNYTKIIINKLRVIWHLSFWGAGFLILLLLFTENNEVQKIDVIYTAVFILPIIIASYINLYLLLPRLLKKERYLFYLIGFLILVMGSSYLIFKLFDIWIDYIFKNYYIVTTLEAEELLIYSTLFLVLTTLLKLSKEWFIMIKTEKEKSLTQLRQLQSQINPHFLLNSLQTIYSLSLHQSEKTPDSILKLSEILKFTLYESENDKVPLKRELEVAREYIEMYRLRLDPDRVKIDLSITGSQEGLTIIPLLFLPFIENSFKHGVQGSEKHAYVNINFQINEKKLTFNIENNSGKYETVVTSEHSGIGISNTRQRLNLQYPGKHSLKLKDNGNMFQVILDIDLS